jgi:hypothetical protein
LSRLGIRPDGCSCRDRDVTKWFHFWRIRTDVHSAVVIFDHDEVRANNASVCMRIKFTPHRGRCRSGSRVKDDSANNSRRQSVRNNRIYFTLCARSSYLASFVNIFVENVIVVIVHDVRVVVLDFARFVCRLPRIVDGVGAGRGRCLVQYVLCCALFEVIVLTGLAIEVNVAFHIVYVVVSIKILRGVVLGRIVGVRSIAVTMKVGIIVVLVGGSPSRFAL